MQTTTSPKAGERTQKSNEKLAVNTESARKLALDTQFHSASSAHTPGPWSISEFDGPQQYASIEANGGCALCPTDLVRICDIPSWPCAVEEMRANANLISAAPDLFSALSNIAHAANEFAEGAMEWPTLRRAIEAARAAISKAKGNA